MCHVRDSSGRIVQVFPVTQTTTFDASGLESGVYMIDVQNNQGSSVWHSRVVVQ
ncbi:MAG: T9SS type A sorting domain-containing protein [Flavobacteriales bacterium]